MGIKTQVVLDEDTRTLLDELARPRGARAGWGGPLAPRGCPPSADAADTGDPAGSPPARGWSSTRSSGRRSWCAASCTDPGAGPEPRGRSPLAPPPPEPDHHIRPGRAPGVGAP